MCIMHSFETDTKLCSQANVYMALYAFKLLLHLLAKQLYCDCRARNCTVRTVYTDQVLGQPDQTLILKSL